MHTARTIREIKVMRPITQGSKQALFLFFTTAGLRKKANKWVISQGAPHPLLVKQIFLGTSGPSGGRVLSWFRTQPGPRLLKPILALVA